MGAVIAIGALGAGCAEDGTSSPDGYGYAIENGGQVLGGIVGTSAGGTTDPAADQLY